MNVRARIFCCTLFAVSAGGVILSLHGSARAADQQPADTPPAILTVYVPSHTSSVTDINEVHSKYHAQGYHFASMVAHRENSDHEGVWITYVRNE
jgi:hypothetical protein